MKLWSSLTTKQKGDLGSWRSAIPLNWVLFNECIPLETLEKEFKGYYHAFHIQGATLLWLVPHVMEPDVTIWKTQTWKPGWLKLVVAGRESELKNVKFAHPYKYIGTVLSGTRQLADTDTKIQFHAALGQDELVTNAIASDVYGSGRWSNADNNKEVLNAGLGLDAVGDALLGFKRIPASEWFNVQVQVAFGDVHALNTFFPITHKGFKVPAAYNKETREKINPIHEIISAVWNEPVEGYQVDSSVKAACTRHWKKNTALCEDCVHKHQYGCHQYNCQKHWRSISTLTKHTTKEELAVRANQMIDNYGRIEWYRDCQLLGAIAKVGKKQRTIQCIPIDKDGRGYGVVRALDSKGYVYEYKLWERDQWLVEKVDIDEMHADFPLFAMVFHMVIATRNGAMGAAGHWRSYEDAKEAYKYIDSGAQRDKMRTWHLSPDNVLVHSLDWDPGHLYMRLDGQHSYTYQNIAEIASAYRFSKEDT
jgi:hypothetical protein